jgi:hypothetical protein
VLPKYHLKPQTFEREGTNLDLIKGIFKGFLVTIFFLLFYLLWDGRVNNANSMSKKMKHGVYLGAYVNFVALYALFLEMY